MAQDLGFFPFTHDLTVILYFQVCKSTELLLGNTSERPIHGSTKKMVIVSPSL